MPVTNDWYVFNLHKSNIATTISVQQTIKQVRKHDMHVPIEYELTIHRFNGPKKPELPTIATFKPVRPLKVLIHKSMATRRADKTDFVFLQDVVKKHGCPEFNGYNTSVVTKATLPNQKPMLHKCA